MLQTTKSNKLIKETQLIYIFLNHIWFLFWSGMKGTPHVCHRVNYGTSRYLSSTPLQWCASLLRGHLHCFPSSSPSLLHHVLWLCYSVRLILLSRNHSYVITYAFVFCMEYESHSTLCCFLYLTVLNVDFSYYHQFHGTQLHHTCNQQLDGYFSCMLHILFCHHI